MNRRRFLIATAGASLAPLVPSALLGQTSTPATTQAVDLEWHDARNLGILGRAFDDVASPFDRLPARAKGVVRDAVWNLSRHAAGMSIRFETDAPAVHVRYALTNIELAMPHMPATGVSGVDLYGMIDGRWHWAGTHLPRSPQVEAALAKGLPPGGRAYLLHLPLYNGVTSLAIGVPRGTALVASPPPPGKPIVWYGTSITQGACASRPGLAFTNILSRRLERTICNFGFSGNGATEVEVGRFLAEIDAGAFVIDTVANTTGDVIRERTIALVRLLRVARPAVPILLLEDREWGAGPLAPTIATSLTAKRTALRSAFDTLVADGVAGLSYRESKGLIGDDGESTVDGNHPNDRGMQRYADALEPTLKSLLV